MGSRQARGQHRRCWQQQKLGGRHSAPGDLLAGPPSPEAAPAWPLPRLWPHLALGGAGTFPVASSCLLVNDGERAQHQEESGLRVEEQEERVGTPGGTGRIRLRDLPQDSSTRGALLFEWKSPPSGWSPGSSAARLTVSHCTRRLPGPQPTFLPPGARRVPSPSCLGTITFKPS